MDAKDVVESYLAAITARDYPRARGLLADRGFRYSSPIISFDSADRLLNHTFLSDGVVRRVEIRKVFVDGDDVCHILRVHAQISERMVVDVVQWAHVHDGRIDRIELVFDASVYRSLFPNGMPQRDP